MQARESTVGKAVAAYYAANKARSEGMFRLWFTGFLW